MDRVTETWVTLPERPVSISNRNACLVHIYPTGPGMGTRYTLADKALVVGPRRRLRHSHQRPFRLAPPCPHPARRRRLLRGRSAKHQRHLRQRSAGLDVQAQGRRLPSRRQLHLPLPDRAATSRPSTTRKSTGSRSLMPLTDIHNKRYLMEFLDRELARSGRYSRPLSLIMLDIDRFRPGQRSLRPPRRRFYAARDWPAASRATSARKSCSPATAARSSPWCCRRRPAKVRSSSAERLRLAIESQPFRYEDKPYNVTISLGIATTAGDETLTPAELLRLSRRKAVPGQKRRSQSRL